MIQQPKIKYNVKPLNGSFVVSTNDLPAGSFPTEAESITGKFVAISIKHDEGTPKQPGKFGVDPYDALIVTLCDEPNNTYYYIKSNIKIVFSQNLVANLKNVSKNDEIKIKVKPGTTTPNVTLVNVFVKNDQAEWKSISFENFNKDIDAVKKAVVEHNAYHITKEKEPTS
jgi:hypothetical protein